MSSANRTFAAVGGIPSPSAESMITAREDSVSPAQFIEWSWRMPRFQTDGKSALPIVSSTGISVMKYFVRFIGSSRPGPHSVQPGRFIQSKSASRAARRSRVIGMIR